MTNLLNKKFFDSRNKSLILTIGICALIFCSMVNTSQWGASLSWVLGACFAIALGRLLVRGGFKPSYFGIFILWGIYLYSTYFSEYVPFNRDYITFLAFCITYLLAVSYDYSKKDINVILNFYIFMAMLVAIVVLFNWLTKNYYVAWTDRASFSFYGQKKDPNYTMAFITPAAYILAYRLIINKGALKKIAIAAMLAVLALTFIATASRASILSLGVALLFMFIFSDIKFTTKLVSFAIAIEILAIALSIVLMVFPDQSINRLFNFSADWNVKLKLWAAGLEPLSKYPLLGGGFGAASACSLKAFVNGNHSHSVIIDILGDSGIVGFIIFIGFFVFNCCISRKCNFGFLLGLALAFMLPMFFINGFNTATFYIPLILLTIISNYLRKKGNKVEDFLN